ncbi:MAG TPA: hypothetical protein VM889_11460 [Candidatus Thermoplasmatota archaeon]|nr:hypothetical protein [Candidatus Thermoplasmatota archaeon]
MPEYRAGTVEARILEFLLDRESATRRAVETALRLRPAEADLALKRLAAHGVLTVQTLGAETYLALSGAPFTLAGRLRRPKPPPPPPRPEDDPAFL